MSYTAAVAALKARCATVTGIRSVITGQPAKPHNLPLMYVEANRGERTHAGQVTVASHFIDAILLIAFQDNVSSEDSIGAFLDLIPKAIDANTGVAPSIKTMYVTEWAAGYMTFGEGTQAVTTRRVTFTVRVKDEGTRGTV